MRHLRDLLDILEGLPEDAEISQGNFNNMNSNNSGLPNQMDIDIYNVSVFNRPKNTDDIKRIVFWAEE